MLLIDESNSKYIDNERSDKTMSSVFLSPSPSSKTLKSYQIDDKKLSIDEPDNLQCTKKRTNSSSKLKVSNVAENKDNFTRVAIQVSENGIIEIISDKETMV